MNLVQEIIVALSLLGPDDIQAARRYLEWMKLRRRINNHFYFAAHWIGDENKYHWVT